MLVPTNDNRKTVNFLHDNPKLSLGLNCLTMKLHQLQALVAAVEHGSIRAAARELHLTQAALTKSLRLLEEDAGVALLIRKSRGVVLTEAGLRLHARAQLVMRQVALAQDELLQAQGDSEGSVRVALTPYLMLTVLGEAFLWFRKRYPRIQLRLVEGLVARVLPGLRDGTVDFAIVADSGDVTPQEFQCIRLQKDQQKLVVRAGHPVLRQPTAAKLAALEWVMPGPFSQGLDEGLLAMFSQAGVAPPSQITRCDAMAAMALIRQTDAMSVMPAPLLAQPEGHGLVELSLRSMRPPDIELVLLSPPEVPLTPAAAYLARCLTDAIAARGRSDSVNRAL
jgi:DNA-binding transcriptional LysR family regulator